MEIYVKGLIATLKKDLFQKLIEIKHGISFGTLSIENAPYVFEGNLMALQKFGMLTNQELEIEKYFFHDLINTPFIPTAVHFFFTVKRDELLVKFEYKGYDIIKKDSREIILYSNSVTLLDDVYSNGLLTFLLFDFSNEDSKTYKFSSIEKLNEQELHYFKDSEPMILTAHSLEEANDIKFLSCGNYILQLDIQIDSD